MRTVKRLEIVISSLHVGKLVELLDAAGVTGYTILPDARGRGSRGERTADELTDALKNAYVLTTCPPEQVDTLLEEIRPMLRRFGGICLVSDARWVER